MTSIILFLLCQQYNLIFGQPESSKTKIVLIGLGGATWKVILPLIEKGRLPNLQKLINKGMWGELFVPVADLPSLTSLVTGKTEEKHGIFEYCEKLTGKYVAPFTPSFVRKTKALWNILTDYRKTVGVVNWWATCPAEKVNGFIISNAFVQSMITLEKNSPFIFDKYLLVYPENVLDKLRKLKPSDLEMEEKLVNLLDYKYKVKKELFKDFQPYRRFNLKEDYLSEQFKERSIVSTLGFLKHDLFVFNLGKYMLSREIPDLFLIFFWGPDIIQHSFWEFYEPDAPKCNFTPTKEEIEKFSKVIPRYYELIDKMIGEILLQYQNEKNVIVVVVSDHGFQGQPIWRYRKLYRLNFIFEKLGWLKYKKNGEINWKKTLIYDFLHDRPSRPVRRLYVNLKGRDPKGIIESGLGYKQFLDMVKEKLENLKTTSGTKIFSKIEKVKINNLSPKIQSPDLLIVFNQSILLEPNIKCEINSKIYSINEFMIPWPRTGTHDNKGIVIFYNPSIENGGRIENATVYDIMPTILNLIDVPIGKEIDGKVLPEVSKIKESLK